MAMVRRALCERQGLAIHSMIITIIIFFPGGELGPALEEVFCIEG